MTRPVWSSPAQRDLLRHAESLQDRDPNAALRILDAIDDRANWLARYPHAGQAVEGTETRSFRVLRTPYVIVYRIVGTTVQVVRVHHGAENWLPR